MHTRKVPILHRDLTSRNVLVKDLVAKVTDFGLSKMKVASDDSGSGVIGAIAWTSPEVW